MNNKEIFKNKLCQDTFSRICSLEKMFGYLDTTDFFIAPSSTTFHCNYPGGLVDHSINVYNLLKEKIISFDKPLTNLFHAYSEETVAIVSLLHDICKANFYVEDKQDPSQAQMKYLQSLSGTAWPTIFKQGFLSRSYVSSMIEWFVKGRKDKQPKYDVSYRIEDQLPLGHGEKSLYLITRYIDLTDEEAAAIRWHMVAFDAGIHFNYPSGFPFREAVKKYPLVTLLFTADFEASNILET